MRTSSVATTTSAFPTRRAPSRATATTRASSVWPAIGISGLPGSRREAKRAGITIRSGDAPSDNARTQDVVEVDHADQPRLVADEERQYGIVVEDTQSVRR